MRVLFWSAVFWPTIGGVEVLAAKLLPALRKRGHEFIVVTPKSYSNLPDYTLYNGIPVHRLAFRNDSTENMIEYVLDVRRRVLRLKQNFLPDLIHINAVGRGDFFHLTTNHTHRIPAVVTLHGRWEEEIEPVVRHTLRNADWIAGCSSAILDQGRQLVPEISCRSSIIYNGVEFPPLPPEPLPFDPPRIVCLGRLACEKGFDLALTAFASILDRFPQARLSIVGNGPARTALEQQAAKEKISQAVEFTGWVAPERVPALINDATIVVMPSREDSLPLVALEAARMARPIVATRVGGLPEVVLHQQTGLLVEKENAGGLADAISFLIAHPDAAVQMGRAAQSRVQTVFSWERHVNAYDALYRQLVNQGKVMC
jgi:glycogen(starch) synthase